MTRPSDIPADVWDTARHVLSNGFTSPIPSVELCIAVARAILAERERAAKVCEDAADDADDRFNRTASEVWRSNYASAHVTCKRLAAAIRSGK